MKQSIWLPLRGLDQSDPILAGVEYKKPDSDVIHRYAEVEVDSYYEETECCLEHPNDCICSELEHYEGSDIHYDQPLLRLVK